MTHDNILAVLKVCLPSVAVQWFRQAVHAAKRRRFLKTFGKEIDAVHEKHGQAIVIMATPVHGNLGDHAIVYAELSLLAEMNMEGRVVEIANDEYRVARKQIRKKIFDTDLIIIDGGGNLGTLWPWEDDKIADIIREYHKNPVCIFPQTCYYDAGQDAQERTGRNRECYCNAWNLLITLRDMRSYEYCQRHFSGTKSLLVPDIVLYLSSKLRMPETANRNGILLCFRSDRERMLTTIEVDRLKVDIGRQGISCKEVSTIRKHRVDRHSRYRELSQIWKEFASAKLVITDRLHGMIFAAINNTPCLAVDNISRKVSGVYELLPPSARMKIYAGMDEVLADWPRFYGMGLQPSVGNGFADKAYQPLKDYIKENIIN